MSKARITRQKIVIIGCGNVAWHLAKQLSALKKYDLLVYNHQPNPALKDFAKLPGCKTFSNLNHVSDVADYCLVAVSDSSISKVETKINLKKPGALIMHTSGSAELSDLGDRAHNSSVFYPLQTFSKGDRVDWKNIPIIIEADNEAVRNQTREFALQFSNHIVFADYKKRLRIHLSAVMVNNFTNALYNAAVDVLNEKKSDRHTIELLLPLITQTVNKLQRLSPQEAQTGPAKRGDELVIEKHLQILEKKTELKKIYKNLTKLINKQQKINVEL
jgi:predicted short-subunit dehydrogenase-like oxidoreductase (DUF2520 family)